MDLTALRNEVLNDPTGKGYASLLPQAPGSVVVLLNAQTEQMYKSRMVSARTILGECVDGAGILDRLESAAEVVSAVKWGVRFLGQDPGLDVGHPATHAMIDQLVAATLLTADDGDALKNMSVQPASRTEVLGIGQVTEADLRAALEE